MRILHVPTDCGNHGPLLAKHERLIGYDSWSIVFAQSYLGYPADEVLGGRTISALIKVELKRLWITYRALKNYDVIFYNFGSTIAPNPVFVGFGLSSMFGSTFRLIYTIYSLTFQMWDVVLLRIAGKHIKVIFQGGDARQGQFLKRNFKWSHYDEEFNARQYYHPLTDLLKRFRAWAWGKLAHDIYFLNPDHGHVLPKRAKFYPYAMEVPPMSKQWTPPTRLTLGHVVNHREPKGTRFVLDAVHKVRMSGKDFGFLFAERIPHTNAMELYNHIDVLLEQFVIGWYGLQAVEFMSQGKPVVVYIRSEDLKFIPKEMQTLPFFVVDDPNKLDTVIQVILEMTPQELVQIGQKCRRWVEDHHDVRKLVRKETYK